MAAVIAARGPQAGRPFVEFFTANIRNPNTRRAYYRATSEFFDWCDQARVSAAATVRVEDYFAYGKRAWLRLHEKGGKRHEVPCHHNPAAYLDAWIDTAGIVGDKKGPLFRAIRKGTSLPRIRWHGRTF